MLLLLSRRIAATRQGEDHGYASLLTDLRVVQESLRAAGALRHAFDDVQHLIWQVETYGFHLAELEVRQHSQVHTRALSELEAGGALSAQTEEVLEVFRAIADIQRERGPRAAGRYVVSFTRSAEDLVNVHQLARTPPGRRRPGPRRSPALRDVRRPPGRSRHPRRGRDASRVRRPPRPDWPTPGGHARLLRLLEERRPRRRQPRALRGPGRDRALGADPGSSRPSSTTAAAP